MHKQHRKIGDAVKKALVQPVIFPSRAGRPHLGMEAWGLGEETASPALHLPFDNPTIAVQENGTYGGQGKAAGFRGPAALLCELSLFVLAVTSRKIDPGSNAGASGVNRPVIVPHTAKGRKLRPRPAECRGAFLGARHNAPTASAVRRKSAHALEDNRGQLHDLLIQYCVFFNLALYAIAVAVKLLS